MENDRSVPGMTWPAVLLIGLSLSIGWGVRGNWGHEFGAMIPGALAAMAVCLASGRDDWRKRVAYFAFFGAMGWSFGGSMSYGTVIGYTHSGSPPDMTYGFACLFLIGFLWGAVGGAGTALPALLSWDRLTELIVPTAAVVAVWTIQGILLIAGVLDTEALYWYDTDWLAAVLALITSVVVMAGWPRFRRAASLIVHMASGWLIGVLLLAELLELHMTPPRSDNWAGILGMTAGMIVYLLRHDLRPAVFASVLTGLCSGIGFSFGNVVKLAGEASAITVNWHSILEQLLGFLAGVGVALSMGMLSTRVPATNRDDNVRPWTEYFCVGFTLLLITFLNIRKNVQAVWLPNDVLPKTMYGLSIQLWFDLAYLVLATVVVLAMLRHSQCSLPVVPSSWLGRSRALYLALLWWIVLGNASRYLPLEDGLPTNEMILAANACICTVLVVWWASRAETISEKPSLDYTRLSYKLAGFSVVVALVLAAVGVGAVRVIYRGKPAGTSSPDLRFVPAESAQQADGP